MAPSFYQKEKKDMYKMRRKFLDFNGNEREEDFYFNLTEAEITKMELSTQGGLDAYIKKISEEQDHPKIIKLFDDLVCMSYGVKSADGKYFMKDPEDLKKFKATTAYSDIYMELATDSDKAAEFVNGITPKEKVQPQDHKQPAKVTNIENKQ